MARKESKLGSHLQDDSSLAIPRVLHPALAKGLSNDANWDGIFWSFSLRIVSPHRWLLSEITPDRTSCDTLPCSLASVKPILVMMALRTAHPGTLFTIAAHGSRTVDCLPLELPHSGEEDAENRGYILFHNQFPMPSHAGAGSNGSD